MKKFEKNKKEWGGTAESSETGAFIGGENASSMYNTGGGLFSKGHPANDPYAYYSSTKDLRKDLKHLENHWKGKEMPEWALKKKKFLEDGIKNKVKESKMNTGGGIEGNALYLELSNIDHTRVIKWMNNQFDNEKIDIKKSGSGYIIDTSKLSKSEVEDLMYYLKQQDYISKYANGGAMNETFPDTDAMSYAGGGGIEEKIMTDVYATKNGKRVKVNERPMELREAENWVKKQEIEKYYTNIDFKFINKDFGYKYANGGSTKGFEYSIGGL